MMDGTVAAEWIWFAFIVAFGACVGSFLNVVIYRLPREKSLVRPGSACPQCNTPIYFYDNIPLVSWLMLRGRCRQCNAPISIRYFLVELLTAVLFAGVYLWFFYVQGRQTGLEGTAMQQFFSGGWLFYLAVMTLLAAFLAASAIDLELWIIPIQLCWFVSMVGLAAAIASGWIIDPDTIVTFQLFPQATPSMAAMAAGAAIGTIIALTLLWLGWIRPSYEMLEAEGAEADSNVEPSEPDYNDRREILKEVVFLLPILIGAAVAVKVAQWQPIADKWISFVQYPAARFGFGALAGYFIGGGVVWATRIFGTLAFGKEAMGLGDVHLMAAAGTVLGPVWVVLAFFIAPFFGILWALYQAIFKKIRQIPYGPFLSTAVFVVIIFHDGIRKLITTLYGV
jgi:leader peptidase (prepilin peptidase)/N-methyltransferase